MDHITQWNLSIVDTPNLCDCFPIVTQLMLSLYYSITSIFWTPLGPVQMSCIRRYPYYPHSCRQRVQYFVCLLADKIFVLNSFKRYKSQTETEENYYSCTCTMGSHKMKGITKSVFVEELPTQCNILYSLGNIIFPYRSSHWYKSVRTWFIMNTLRNVN